MQTKYTMAVAIAEVAGLSTEGFVRVDDAPAPGSAPRPQFERMSCKRLEKLLEDAKETSPDGFRTDFKASLAEALLPHLSMAGLSLPEEGVARTSPNRACFFHACCMCTSSSETLERAAAS